ncbi:MAG: nucleotidyltransferase family protein [Candidatus Thorarchaeota archaeon]
MNDINVIDILKNNNTLLQKYYVKRIGVFGSYVRGEEDDKSDIDILVEFDESSFGENFKGYFDTVTSLSADLESVLNKRVDLVTIHSLSPYIAPRVMKEVKFVEGL